MKLIDLTMPIWEGARLRGNSAFYKFTRAAARVYVL